MVSGDEIHGGLRPGRLGLVAQTQRGVFVAVTAARIFSDPFSGVHAGTMPANELIVARALPDLTGGDQQPICLLSMPEALGKNVFRVQGQSRVSGRVTAIHGGIAVAGRNLPLSILDTLEIEFSEDARHGGTPPPDLEAKDLGGLIMTFDGGAVGLIVGGGRRLAIVAPLQVFFDLNRLSLAASSFKPSSIDVGLDSFFADITEADPPDWPIPEAKAA